MSLRRIARHLFTTVWSARRAFPPTTLQAIERTIHECEQTHEGQIRFVVEHSLDFIDLLHGVTARQRAVDVFGRLRVWDTEHNNGVLIYLLLADRSVEILADRGVHAHVGPRGWEPIGREMERELRSGHFQEAIVNGIRAVSRHLERHYPSAGRRTGELPDQPVML